MEKRGVCLTAGPLLMFLGGTPLLFLVGFVIKPDIEGWEWWGAFLKKMFDFSSSGAGCMSVLCGTMFLLGAILFLIGVGTILGDLLAWVRQPKSRAVETPASQVP